LSDQDSTFPRDKRLISAADYAVVFKQPVKSSDRYFSVLARGNSIDHPRLGMAIAKKSIKTAVGRNRVKRTVRESFRLHFKQLGSFDLVVLARPEAAQVDRAQLRRSLERHWQRLNKRFGGSITAP